MANPHTRSPFRADLCQGQVVLITGGGTGIGLGVAKAFAAHGAKVMIMGRREEVLQKAVKEIGNGAAYVQGDVRDFESCKRAVDACVAKFGGLDTLVSNAAGNFAVAAEDLSPNAMKTVMEIDFMGTFHMCKAALEPLKKSKNACIIATSASLHYKAFPFQAHAASAKSAIDTLIQDLGVEWGAAYGIRAVCIAPGPIAETAGGPTGRVFGGFGAPDAKSKGAEETIRRIVPVGRYGYVEDIAYAAIYCAGPGSFINATRVVVDGGHWHETAGHFLALRDVIRQISENERKTTKGGVPAGKPKL